MSGQPPKSKDQWASRIGVILAVAGSAVGLGNFLRFPGQAAQHGGGAFLIPYFVSLLVLGMPLGWAEWTMGRYAGGRGFNSTPAIFRMLSPSPVSQFFGAVALLIPLVIYMYYVVIEAWCLSYALSYLSGDLMLGKDNAPYGAFFGNLVGSGADGALFRNGHSGFLLKLCAVFVLNFCLIYRGVSRGIELLCQWAMPAMFVCAVCVLVRVLTLGAPVEGHPEQNVLNGLGFMWNPQFEALADPKTWLAAAGQIFFSLSVGFGIIINYASYLKKEDDIALSGLTASSMNEFFEVCLGGMITIPAAFVFLGATVSQQGTFGLGFNSLPNVFAVMPGGQVFGFLWFFMLFLAAITSSVSMLQPVIAFLEEGFSLKRHASVALLGLLSALGCGFVAFFSKDLTALDTLDFWIGTTAIFLLAMYQTVLYGWAFGIDRGDAELHQGSHIRIPFAVQFVLKYVSPVYLAAIFLGFAVLNLPGYADQVMKNSTARLSIAFAAVVFTFLLLLVNIANRRWSANRR